MNALLVAGSLALLGAAATSDIGFAGGDSSRARGAADFSAYEGVQKRDCRPASAPKVLPSAGSVVDGSSLQAAIGADSVSVPPEGATFSLRFATGGQAEWVEPITVDATGNQLDPRLQAILARHVRLQPAAKDPWSVRLKIIPGDTIGYEVSRSVFCPVTRIFREGGGTERVSGIATMDEINELRNSGEARVVIDVSPVGQILRVALVQSSGSRIADDIALRGIREAAFRPALLDGIPVAGEYEHKSRSTMR